MRRIAIAFAIVVVLGAAVAWFTRARPIPVALREVAEGKVEATLANTRAGTVEACQRTKLSTIIGGRIEYLGVKEGDRVRKGQLLLKLWNDDQQANAALAKAQMTLSAKRSEEACIAAVNAEKARILYECIDRSGGFYANPVDPECRSRMNVPFTLVDPELDAAFLAESKAAGLVSLKGHKSVGGMRASIYNAISLEGVRVLVDFMNDFARRNG